MPRVAKFGGNVRFYESTRTPLEAKKTDSRHKAATLRMSAHKRGGQTMKIRIYETDFEGNPVECTGDFFSGATALDIVNAMKMNPFQASLTPLNFMRWMLASSPFLTMRKRQHSCFSSGLPSWDTPRLNLTRTRLILSIPFRRCRGFRKSKFHLQNKTGIYI